MNLYEYLENLKNKRVAVIGAGISNTPLIELLLENGISVTVHDKRNREEIGDAAGRFEEAGAGLKLGAGYLDSIDADVIFRTPGLMPNNPALAKASEKVILTSEMEVFFQVCPCKIIAVTGSDGKTTTTSIIAELLKNSGITVHLGGNIGTPLLCRAGDIKEDDIAVVELSSFQLITMKKSPHIAVVTNVAPNHLDIHSDMDEYIAAKRNIYLHPPVETVVLNLDNEITRKFAETVQGEVLFFSRKVKPEHGVYLENGIIYDADEDSEIMKAEDILLPGVHNAENFMAAFAATRGLVTPEVMAKTAKTFGSVAHRIEFIRELHGVKYYNDSIASSPTRTIAGLRAFEKKVILIAGGKDKGIGFDELAPEIIKHVKTLVLTGLTAGKILSAVVGLPEYAGRPGIIIEKDFTRAVLAAAQSAQEGDIVLLSPACTSFDRFKNFEQRGDTFREIVKGLT